MEEEPIEMAFITCIGRGIPQCKNRIMCTGRYFNFMPDISLARDNLFSLLTYRLMVYDEEMARETMLWPELVSDCY